MAVEDEKLNWTYLENMIKRTGDKRVSGRVRESMPCKRSSEDVRKAAVALLRGNLSGLEQQRSCYVCYGSHRTKDCKMFELGVVANEMPPAAHAV